MNLTRAQKTRLGVFLATGTVILVSSVITLAGLAVWEKRDLYTVRFKDNVSGLERSAQVKLQGLRVGRVERLRIAPDDPATVEVMLSLEADTPLHEGVRAILDSSGLTGLKTINLEGGDPRQPRLAPGAIIPAGESFLDRVTGKAEAVAAKAEVVANQLARWTSDENRMRVERLIDGVDALVKDLDTTVNETRDPLKRTLDAVADVSQKTARLEAEGIKTLSSGREEIEKTALSARRALDQIAATARDVDGKEVTAAITSARRAMDELDRRLGDEETGKAIADLRTTLKDTGRLLQDLDLTVRAGREDFVTSLSYIRQAAEDLREFSRIIAQDPSVLLRGQEVRE